MHVTSETTRAINKPTKQMTHSVSSMLSSPTPHCSPHLIIKKWCNEKENFYGGFFCFFTFCLLKLKAKGHDNIINKSFVYMRIISFITRYFMTMRTAQKGIQEEMRKLLNCHKSLSNWVGFLLWNNKNSTRTHSTSDPSKGKLHWVFYRCNKQCQISHVI